MRYSTVFAAYLLVTILWTAFGLHMQSRSQSQSDSLKQAVSGLWGTAHHQVSPTLRDGQGGLQPLQKARVAAALNLEYRQKGLFWYSTYTVDFEGAYCFTNPTQERSTWDFRFPLPARHGMYSGFKFYLDGAALDNVVVSEGQVRSSIAMEPGATREVRVAYHSQGCDEWYYNFLGNQSSPTRGLELRVKTNFGDVDFPDGTLSPTTRSVSGNEWTGVWDYKDLISGGQVGIAVPHKTDAAPQLINVCLYAPFGLLGFFVVLLAFRVSLHPVHFLLLGAGYFSFHLLLAYLGDVAPMAVAFPVAAAVTYFLELSYLGRVAGRRFAVRGGLVALTLYLVMFSSAFLVEHRGLLLIGLAVLTLYLMMQVTARVKLDG